MAKKKIASKDAWSVVMPDHNAVPLLKAKLAPAMFRGGAFTARMRKKYIDELCSDWRVAVPPRREFGNRKRFFLSFDVVCTYALAEKNAPFTSIQRGQLRDGIRRRWLTPNGHYWPEDIVMSNVFNDLFSDTVDLHKRGLLVKQHVDSPRHNLYFSRTLNVLVFYRQQLLADFEAMCGAADSAEQARIARHNKDRGIARRVEKRERRARGLRNASERIRAERANET